MLGFKLLAAFAAVAPAFGRPAIPLSTRQDGLPVVDLGYELHEAFSLDQSGIYNFSNIRYAAPPLGELRFRAPVGPCTNRTGIQKGDVGRVCPSADPIWSKSIAPVFMSDYFRGLPFNGSANISSYQYTPAPQDPRATEDCLFLDVLTPKNVFDGRANKSVPVLVWIYGGGYVGGDKDNYNATGLMSRSIANGGEGFVFVSFNYRLGAFGWLAGKELQADGVANAALYDQRFALEWVRNNIHLFGGNPNNVTVMGESAGGGSIMHQVVSYGGQNGPLPFQRAILQSPGWLPVPHQEQQNATLQEFLQILNVSTIQQARRLPSSQLIAANAYQVAKSPYGSFTYGPVVDGLFVPQPVGQMLIGGQFHHDVEIMVGHNANEGVLFTSPNDRIQAGLIESIQELLSNINPGMVDYLQNHLYPPIFNGTYGYRDNIGRAALVIGDVAFQCNTDYLNRAFHNKTYSYMFSVPPAFHGQDTAYTFYNNGTNSSSVLSTTVAYALQDYITSFVESGVPKSSLGPAFPQHGPDARLVDLGLFNISVIRDPTANERCVWWESTPY